MNLKDVIIVFDTNVYLNIYRFSPDYANFILESLKQLENQIIMPMTIYCEYQKHHYKAYKDRQKSIDNYADETIQLITSQKEATKNSFSRLRIGKFPNIETLINSITNKYDKAVDEIRDYFDNHSILEAIKDSWSDDKVETFVESLHRNKKVLPDIPLSRVFKLCEEGEKRFKNKIPPGHCDDKHKTGVRPYSDYFWWNEVLEYARNNKKNIVIVTDDAKKDFWDSDTKSLLPGLVEEFTRKTKYRKMDGTEVELNLEGYSSKDFFENYSKDKGVNIPDAIDLYIDMTDDDYIESIEDKAFDKIFRELSYSGDEYLDISSFDHIGDNEILDWDLEERDFLDYTSLRDGFEMTYYLRYNISLSTKSNDYFGRDWDTKEIMTSDFYEHVAEGEIIIKVTRKLDYNLDFSNEEFESASIEQCLLKQKSFVDNNYEEDEESVPNSCPICGQEMNFENDAGNGFCIHCTRSGKVDE